MIERIFTALYEAMTGAVWLAVIASFGWGILSILLSPCHLSSIPLVIGFITSQGKISISRTFYISLIFAVGILITIAAIGIITASLGRLMGDVGSFGNYLVAGIFFLVGLYLLDIIKFDWNNIGLKQTKAKGLLAALILGLLFGIALGPCTFAYMAPVLGIVFQTAQTNYLLAVLFLLAFGIGHCSVIVGAGTLTGKVQKYLNWSEESKTILRIKRICGILVIFGGVYLIAIVN
ncbi:MAG: cytochrome C biogenesis protein [Ignavibacteria bacterium RIFOXYB2_FULL_35_12]|nr:MAG: cytochrome C biogenesis protein [Ignavibacteria bacterium GWA2_36_19]OGU51401.1 MAG: cytochrome C biogenesis protein [Ignavibacteria bacterium GWC2_35_8]OGU59128.1 MAG: cytochrome C biogenesis protein [Ignavibacteria bacterium GWF2_35_20]OGU82025.1 MAG: cytochrome C biogenesis protein [Ignavibacteria bacterium RIFOXYA2_FULL_35_9]OGU88606.1 MAG: cytochrome C biogenesis protein [Ignavibacteria bacterium RIFOXYA12_FULL_35_25]OGU89957.1 MAG: cytochrome C biogenesis protein [Ignavibacteria 